MTQIPPPADDRIRSAAEDKSAIAEHEQLEQADDAGQLSAGEKDRREHYS